MKKHKQSMSCFSILSWAVTVRTHCLTEFRIFPLEEWNNGSNVRHYLCPIAHIQFDSLFQLGRLLYLGRKVYVNVRWNEATVMWMFCFVSSSGCYFLLSQWSCFWLQGTQNPPVLHCWKPVYPLPHWICIKSKRKVRLCGGKCRSASVFNITLRRFTLVLGLVISHLDMD